jgi:hypothetical protein
MSQPILLMAVAGSWLIVVVGTPSHVAAGVRYFTHSLQVQGLCCQMAQAVLCI